MNVRKVVWTMPTAKEIDYVNKRCNTEISKALNNITFYFQKNKLTGMVMQRNNSEFQGFIKHSKRFSSEFKTDTWFPNVQHAKIYDNGEHRTTMLLDSFKKKSDGQQKTFMDKYEPEIKEPSLISNKFLKAWLDRDEKERKIRFKVGF